MGRKSTVKLLSPEIKSFIDAAFARGNLTLDGLISELRERFPGHALPSRSAVHRYGSKLERKLEVIRASTEAAKLIDQEIGDNLDSRSASLIAMIQSELFDAIMTLQEAGDESKDISPEERVEMLSKAAKNIATLTRSSAFHKRFQREERDAIRQELLQEQRQALADLPLQGGVTPEAVAAIRKTLGIAA
jgi:hypothetical protein